MARAAQERDDLDEELPVSRVDDAATLREHRVERRAAPLASARIANRERHCRRTRRDAELVEQAAEIRIALAIADDETHVDRVAVRLDRVDVAPCARRGLEQRD